MNKGIRPYILAESNWDTLRNASFDLAVLPWGATEAHNYHLPYATDNYESEYIAAESAKRSWERGGKLIVLPNIPYGVNTGQSDIYLDMNLNPSTQMAILSDIVTTLNRQGIYKLLIFNSHGGNNFKPLIRELGLKFPKMFICYSNWFQAMDRASYFEATGDHAEEMETSLMLYLKEDLVLPKDKWGSGDSKKFRIKSLNEGWAWAERKWSQISVDTGVGNPALATKLNGEKFFNDLCDTMSNLLLELCEADISDLYE